MDLRGEVAAEVPDEYLGGHATTPALAHGLSAAIARELAERVAAADETGPDGRPTAASVGALRRGPRIVVVADDFDILDAGGAGPLEPLMPYLSSARDLRLHVLLSRPVAGVGRAMYGPALQTLRDTGGAVLLMWGSEAEEPGCRPVEPSRCWPAGVGWSAAANRRGRCRSPAPGRGPSRIPGRRWTRRRQQEARHAS